MGGEVIPTCSTIGAHVHQGERNGYGDIAPWMRCVVSVGQGGAFDEVSAECARIYRDTAPYLEAPPNMDSMTPEQARETARVYYLMFAQLWRSVEADFYVVLNEPFNDESQNWRAYLAYEDEMMTLAEAEGKRLCVCNFAGGSPGDWEFWVREIVPHLLRAERGGHVYGRHAYGGLLVKEVDGETVPYDDNIGRIIREVLYLRSIGCNIRVFGTEIGFWGGFGFVGVDMFVEQTVAFDVLCLKAGVAGIAMWSLGDWEHHNSNWQDAIPAMTEYLIRVSEECVDMVDHDGVTRQGMGYIGLHWGLFTFAKQFGELDYATGEKKVTHPNGETFSYQWFRYVGDSNEYKATIEVLGENEWDKPFWVDAPPQQFAIHDVVDELPKHPTKTYQDRTKPITHIAIHHSAGPGNATPLSIAQFHVNVRDWPGIAYHYFIDGNGQIFKTNRHETMSYHVGGHNDYAIGICIDGTFVEHEPAEEQQEAVSWLVEKLKGEITTVVTVQAHKKFPDQSTRCCGDLSLDWYQNIAWRKEPPVSAENWLAYFVGKRGAYRLRGTNGHEETCWTMPPNERGEWLFVKNKNCEQFRLNGNMLQRGWDTSESETRCYAQYTDGTLFHDWLDIKARIGSTITTSPFVQHYSKPDGEKLNSGTVTSSRTLQEHYDIYTVRDEAGNVTEEFNNVLVLTWTGGEWYAYAENVGLIEFEARGVRHFFKEWTGQLEGEQPDIEPWMEGLA